MLRILNILAVLYLLEHEILCVSVWSRIRFLTLLTLTETSHTEPSNLEENRLEISLKATWETLRARQRK